MIIYALVAAAFVIVLIAAAIVVLRAGIVREERDRSLLDHPATRAAGFTRRMVGLHVRAPRYVLRASQAADPRKPEHHSAEHPCTTGQNR